jgi:hypothetical protein
MKESTRAYIYRVLLAVQPLIAAYGVATEEKSVLWLSFASAVLSTGLAVKNTSTSSEV